MTLPAETMHRNQENHHHDGSSGMITKASHSVGTQLKQIYAGAIAGACTRTLTQPFDVLKIRFQLQVEPVFTMNKADRTKHTSKYTSLLQASRLIYKEEGVRGLWKGHNAGQFMSIVYSVVQFWTFEQTRLYMQESAFWENHRGGTHFISGGIAGCTASFFSMPFDVIRTRLVAQDPGAGYKNIFDAVPAIFRQEGIPGYFRGLGTTMVQIAPMVGLNFYFYKQFNDIIKDLIDSPDGLLPTWILLVNGGAAGVASKAAVYPLDFVKKRLQMRGFENQRLTYGRNQVCQGFMHCIELTVKHEGLLGFYKGMAPTLLKSGLTTAFYFSIYDYFKLLLLPRK